MRETITERPTRGLILATAERLYAEQGIVAVSNRQISEAAGQGNNAAVGYHFGTKTDLIRAILQHHNEPRESLRRALAAQHAGRTDLRAWLTCLVLPSTAHLAALGTPSWYARFAAQLLTDPALRRLAAEEHAPERRAVLDQLRACLTHLPPDVRDTRVDMAHTLIAHTCADRERAGATEADWAATGAHLIDALEGLFTAPVRSPGRGPVV
ncbi:TetR/AcrR family transcriptional regulator [Symbioplanes lichenis]|uniref:TetR/AcrR family transcriptional regulator n=1 Tax=Symbioplanes lichenis TaxID=1629072 RepID=UPI002739D6F2|nr:TetR family transcriptional regulator [Actinoplanes lichenis]